jgi:hypothetical protein
MRFSIAGGSAALAVAEIKMTDDTYNTLRVNE